MRRKTNNKLFMVIGVDDIGRTIRRLIEAKNSYEAKRKALDEDREMVRTTSAIDRGYA